MRFLAYIRHYPFSVMALCNILGDSCYLGFAFAAQGLVSPPKLLGALLTIAAHIVLLAYADDRAAQHAKEDDYAGQALSRLRDLSRFLLSHLPPRILSPLRARPIGMGFAMLSLNGVALLVDALRSSVPAATLSQITLGLCILTGCGVFSISDFTKNQKTADISLKLAPTILTLANIPSVALAMATHNLFIIASSIIFLFSNFAGFYTKIDKKSPRPV
jgi:hypothetical protein